MWVCFYSSIYHLLCFYPDVNWGYDSTVINARSLHFWITKHTDRGSSSRGTFPHFAWALLDQPDYTRGHYLCMCHLQLAPISDFHPVFQPAALEAALFHVGCFELLLRKERQRGAEMTLFPRPGRTPRNFLLNAVVCPTLSPFAPQSFLFPQRTMFVAEAAETWT